MGCSGPTHGQSYFGRYLRALAIPGSRPAMAFKDSSHVGALPAPRPGDHDSCVLEQHMGEPLKCQRTMT